MTRQELIKNLNYYLKNSQPSERFAMYRLITPVVDFANELMGLNTYFEYNQTSIHGSHQSVDIAMLDEDKPIVLIEAKRLRRRLSAEQINKYLVERTRGIVTDGENWILCLNGKNKNVNILNQFGRVADSELDEIISFIRNENVNFDSSTTENNSYISNTKPIFQKKEKTAIRTKNEISILETTIDLNNFIHATNRITELEKVFLLSFFKQMENLANKSIICESRKTRISFFTKETHKRVGRIELGKKNPDILILTELVEMDNSIENIIKSFPHDKGSHMRRFRLDEKQKAIEFGKKMIDLIK